MLVCSLEDLLTCRLSQSDSPRRPRYRTMTLRDYIKYGGLTSIESHDEKSKVKNAITKKMVKQVALNLIG